MHVGTYIKEKQPGIFNKLNKSNKHKHRRGKKERLSFNYIKNLMEDGHVYRRHKGAWRQVK